MIKALLKILRCLRMAYIASYARKHVPYVPGFISVKYSRWVIQNVKSFCSDKKVFNSLNNFLMYSFVITARSLLIPSTSLRLRLENPFKIPYTTFFLGDHLKTVWAFDHLLSLELYLSILELLWESSLC